VSGQWSPKTRSLVPFSNSVASSHTAERQETTGEVGTEGWRSRPLSQSRSGARTHGPSSRTDHQASHSSHARSSRGRRR
jgi:hypothetical protein